MHNPSRSKDDYQIGKSYYFVKISSGIPETFEFWKVRILREQPGSQNDFSCGVREVYVGSTSTTWQHTISYSWLARDYNEAIDEIVNSKLSKELIVKHIMRGAYAGR